LAIGDVSLGLFRVSLDGVGVSLRNVDVFRGELVRVNVEFDLSFKPQRLTVEGGELVIEGSRELVEQELQRWRDEQPKPVQAEKTAGGIELAVSGVDVTWQHKGHAAKLAQVSGLGYTKSREGFEQLTFGALNIEESGIRLSVSGAALSLARRDGERVLSELNAGKVDARLNLSELSSSGPEASGPAPTEAAKARSQAPATGSESRLAKTLPPVDAERGGRWRASLGVLSSALKAKLPPAAKVHLKQLDLNVLHDGQTLHLGPNQFSLERRGDGIALALSPASGDHASPLALKVDLPFSDRPVRASLSGGPVKLASLGVKEGDFSLEEVGRSELALSSELELGSGGKVLDVLLDGRIEPLSFKNTSLSDTVLRGSRVRWNAKGRALADGSRYDVERLELAVGDVRLTLSGVLERQSDRVMADFKGGIPLASCQSLLDSAPEGLLSRLKGLKFSGTFALDARVAFDSSDLGKMSVKWDFKNECRVTEAPPELAPRRFLNVFRMQVKDVTGRVVNIETGPGTLGWAPYAAISPHMETAVLICEDGGFFRHRGFDREAIENSIKENVKAGRFARGASTISMQLAKNLYLSFDKTLARKLQEAVLTSLLEQELSKQEMMELYLNVIEYGPGIYGIGAAAKHYFNTTPLDLSLSQALYLASILPNPAQQHFSDSGALSEGWHRYLRRLMGIAVKIGRLSEAEYQAASSEVVRFGEANSDASGGMFLPAETARDSAFEQETEDLGDTEHETSAPGP